MKKIAVISGKGGTGKTIVTGGIADHLNAKMIICDADADASNLDLILKTEILSRIPHAGLKIAEIDQDKCIGCGECYEFCRFDSVIERKDGTYLIDSLKCEGCGVCGLVCPAECIELKENICGEVFISRSPYGTVVHSELKAGSGATGLLVHEIKKYALEEVTDEELMLIDGPPGIGCPLQSTMSGTDYALIVTEPSQSGLHDLKRLVQVLEKLSVEIFACINKYDLNPAITEEITSYLSKSKVPLLGEIPFDKTVIESVRSGIPVTKTDSPASDAVKEICIKLSEKIH